MGDGLAASVFYYLTIFLVLVAGLLCCCWLIYIIILIYINNRLRLSIFSIRNLDYQKSLNKSNAFFIAFMDLTLWIKKNIIIYNN
jgi:hypothetical protein